MIEFTLKTNLPIQGITNDELNFISKFDVQSILGQELLTKTELDLLKKLTKQHKEFREYLHQNFDFQIFYQEYYTKEEGFGLKNQFTVYAKVPIGSATRDIYYFYERQTWFDEKKFKSFHLIMKPILDVCWNHLKINDVSIYDPMRSNIKMRNKDHTKNLSLLPTLDPNFQL